ncbi:hypothetical protein ACHAWF_011063 [Thalassiosira exigua]
MPTIPTPAEIMILPLTTPKMTTAPEAETNHPSTGANGKRGAVNEISTSGAGGSGGGGVNIPTAYLLWLVGGVFGVHHAYLNRPRQGLAWYATSGLFGLGLLRDLFRIPYYASLCRDDRSNDVTARVRAATFAAREGVPRLSIMRIALMAFFGVYFGFVASCLVSLPKVEDVISTGEGEMWWADVVYKLLRAMGSAVGIWVVANMGEEMIQTRSKDSDIYDVNQKGEFMGLMKWCTGSMVIANVPVLGGIIYAARRRKYRPTMSFGQKTEAPSSATSRIVRHLLRCAAFTALLTLGAYNHGSVVVNGKKLYLQYALRNAINSRFWQEFDWEQFRQQQQSSSGAGSEYLKRAFDLQGERAARRTLGVARDAPHSDVRSAYKKLALKYHPDKIGSNATDEEIEKAKRQFNKVQEAYNILNDMEQAMKKRERDTTADEL